MVNRAQIMRPVEGGVVHQGWLHPDSLMDLGTLFSGRPMSVCAPVQVALPPAQLDAKTSGFLSRLWSGWGRVQEHAMRVLPSQPLPFDDASQAMVWSPLWLHHVEDPEFQIKEWLRILKPEGGLFFTCFGPDSIRELAGCAQVLGLDLPDFADMHDIGDLLSKQGFSDPVMEMERLTLTYTTPQSLLADLHALLGRNTHARRPGLLGRQTHTRALQQLEALRQNATGRIPLTLELVYGHAWKVERRPKTQVSTVKLQDIGGRSAGKSS